MTRWRHLSAAEKFLSNLIVLGNSYEFLAKRRHDFSGEQTHGLHDLGVRDSAEIESGRQGIEIVILHRVADTPNALFRIPVVVPPGGKHRLPIVFGGRRAKRPSPNARNLVVALDRGHAGQLGLLRVFVHMSAHVKLAVLVAWIEAGFDQPSLSCLDAETDFFRRMRMADGHDVITLAPGPP